MSAVAEAANLGIQYCETSYGPVPFKHYGNYTEGRRLIAVHGLSASVLDWVGFAELIETPFTAVGIPGYIRERPSLNDLAIPVSETIDFVTRDDQSKYDILGISLGGYIVQKVANRSRDVRKMILAATLLATPYIAVNKSDPRAVAMVRTANRENFDAAIALGGDFRANPELASKIKLLNRPIVDPIHHTRQQEVLFDVTSMGLLAWVNTFTRLRHDILTLHGNDDPLLGYEAARSGARWLGSRLVTFDKGGHLFLFTRPKSSADVINRFRNAR